MIALACDHGGFELMQKVRSHLDSKNIDFRDFGTFIPQSCDYPEVAAPATRAVLNGECDKAILICGTGIGISIAANKTPGIRAALCTDIFMAEMARSHNDANVLALGGRVLDSVTAFGIIDKFLNTPFSDETKHRLRVEMLNAMDDARK